MTEESEELLDMAIYKEIASQALYIAAQSKTKEPGARALLKDLANQELGHSIWLKELRENGAGRKGWHLKKVPQLMISEYLTGADTLNGAGLQDTLIFATKREQQSIEFYSRMMSLLRSRSAKQLCRTLATEELKHKLRLETFYEDTFYVED